MTSGDGADVFDWRLGEFRRVTRVTPEPLASRGERPGPVVANTARARQITPMRELRARREYEQCARLVEDVAAEAARPADERGWEWLVVSGERLTTPLVAALPARLRDVAIRDPRRVGDDAGSAAPAMAADAGRTSPA